MNMFIVSKAFLLGVLLALPQICSALQYITLDNRCQFESLFTNTVWFARCNGSLSAAKTMGCIPYNIDASQGYSWTSFTDTPQINHVVVSHEGGFIRFNTTMWGGVDDGGSTLSLPYAGENEGVIALGLLANYEDVSLVASNIVLNGQAVGMNLTAQTGVREFSGVQFDLEGAAFTRLEYDVVIQGIYFGGRDELGPIVLASTMDTPHVPEPACTRIAFLALLLFLTSRR